MHLVKWASLLEFWWKQERKGYQAIQSPCCQQVRLAVTSLREKQLKIGEGDFIWIISCFDWQSSMLTVTRPRRQRKIDRAKKKVKTQVEARTWNTIILPFGGGKKKQNIKWELIHISTEEISDSLGSFFFSSRQKDNLYLCVSLLLLWLLCFLNFWLDWLKWLRSASTKKKQQKNKKKKNTTKRKGDKLIHDAQTWRHPTTTTNHGSQTREEER